MADVVEAIEDWRIREWKGVSNLAHRVEAIFSADAEGFDLIAFVHYSLSRPDGSKYERRSAARQQLIEQDGKLKIKKLDLIAVSSTGTF